MKEFAWKGDFILNRSALPDAISDLQNTLQQLQLQSGMNTVYDQVIQSLQQDLNTIMQKVTASQGSPNQQPVESIRTQLAQLRNQIQQAIKDLDGSVDATLNLYRSTLGNQKDQFEALPQTSQQTANPVAYSALQTFKQDQGIRDLLTQLNGALMSVSTSLELQSQGTGTTPPTTNVNYDNDPAPHHLSP